MGAVDGDYVNFGCRQFLGSLQEISSGADGRAYAQASLRIFGGVGILQFLLNVFYGDESLEVVFVVDDEKFFDAMFVENFLGIFESGADGTVMRFFLVITRSIGISKRVSKRRSRLVRMPTRRPCRVMGTPEILYLRMTSSASLTLSVGDMVTGSTIIPLSERFTLSTSLACWSIVRLRWIMPSPPCCASAIAMCDSVTVSMAELTMGMLRRMLRVSWVCVLAVAELRLSERVEEERRRR